MIVDRDVGLMELEREMSWLESKPVDALEWLTSKVMGLVEDTVRNTLLRFILSKPVSRCEYGCNGSIVLRETTERFMTAASWLFSSASWPRAFIPEAW